MATPEPATIMFEKLTGGTIPIDAYISDVDAAMVNLDGGAGASATSPTNYVIPAHGVIRDIAIVTGNTVTTKLQINRNGVDTGAKIRSSVHLTTLAGRPRLNIGFAAGDQLTIIQRA